MRWLNEYSQKFLENGYLLPGESVETRVMNMARAAEKFLGKTGWAQKFYDYMALGYYVPPSPVWANFGLERGLPISCFGSYLADNMGSILYSQAEVGMMSKFGGGSSGYFGALRARGATIKDNGTSSGSVHFMQLFESLVDVVSQGSVRRGHFSPYLPVEHPDIEEFLKIGTEGNKIQKLTHGVTVGDKWLQEMVDGDEQKRSIWAKIIQSRTMMGYPYILFTDNANNGTVEAYKDKGYKIHASNMCTEIMLPSKEDWSFVCNLSGMNLLYYDEWKNTDAVETLVEFLDAVMSEFIMKLEKLRDSSDPVEQQSFYFMQRAHKFAVENRAVGLGALGWHSYLQSKMIAFASPEARALNKEIFSFIHDRAYAASAQLAKEYGEPEVMKGYGRRNATLMAVAPNTSSGFIIGQVSQGIEPWWSNCYVKDLAKIKVTIKNTELEKLLESKGRNDRDTWQSIRDHDGSVQHLDCLSDHEKAVFKTFSEINQYAILDQAADRQKFIDQGQSLNLMINPKTPAKEVNALYLEAWKLGIKSLYYQHSKSAAQELSRKIVCVGCEA
jgi:ribonucleoside-diphosphate reductase alpha chain